MRRILSLLASSLLCVLCLPGLAHARPATVEEPNPARLEQQSAEQDQESAVGDRLLVIHDSVILGARRQIEATFPDTTVEYIGFGGLRVGPAADLVSQRPDLITDQVVIEIGTNYLGSRKLFRTELDRMMGLLAHVDHVVWLTAGRYSPRMDAVNEEIRDAARRYPNLQIAEWGPLSDRNGEFTWGDGIHLQPGGADAIAELIRAHLEGDVPWNQLPEGRIGALRDGRKAVTVKGWASNPDLGRSAMVRLLVDGELVQKKLTHLRRANLAKQIGTSVVKIGFEFRLELPDGTHELCIEANNFDGFAPVRMHCRSIEVRHNPTGAIDRVITKTTGEVVRGWAQDPDRKKPVVIEIREGSDPGGLQHGAAGDGLAGLGEVITRGKANRLSKTSPNGPAHNFAVKVPVGIGDYCIVAKNVLAGSDTVLSCRAAPSDLLPLSEGIKTVQD